MKKYFAIFIIVAVVVGAIVLSQGDSGSDNISETTRLPEVAETTQSSDAEESVQTPDSTESTQTQDSEATTQIPDITEIPDTPYIEVNNNIPYFTEEDYTTEAFEEYSELDELGRCGVAYANICPELMPEEDRGAIGHVRPSGWHTVKYPEIISDLYLYNRCHLIGYQLAGENANEKNLITGTRYLNMEGMLPYENLVSEYVKSTGNHVLYRVTPMYEGDNLVASAVGMEGWSVEDNGAGICFNICAYNIQPGIIIDYSTGDSRIDEEYQADAQHNDEGNQADAQHSDEEYQADAQHHEEDIQTADDNDEEAEYVLNTNTKRYHRPECPSVKDISDKNKSVVTESRSALEAMGYKACGNEQFN